MIVKLLFSIDIDRVITKNIFDYTLFNLISCIKVVQDPISVLRIVQLNFSLTIITYKEDMQLISPLKSVDLIYRCNSKKLERITFLELRSTLLKTSNIALTITQ